MRSGLLTKDEYARGVSEEWTCKVEWRHAAANTVTLCVSPLHFESAIFLQNGHTDMWWWGERTNAWCLAGEGRG